MPKQSKPGSFGLFVGINDFLLFFKILLRQTSVALESPPLPGCSPAKLCGTLLPFWGWKNHSTVWSTKKNVCVFTGVSKKVYTGQLWVFTKVRLGGLTLFATLFLHASSSPNGNVSLRTNYTIIWYIYFYSKRKTLPLPSNGLATPKLRKGGAVDVEDQLPSLNIHPAGLRHAPKGLGIVSSSSQHLSNRKGKRDKTLDSRLTNPSTKPIETKH